MKYRAIGLFVIGSMALALAFMPQSTAQAKTCYDSSKNVIPCPQSNYKQTQQAKKANGPSDTPVLPTKTPTPTPTDFSVPTSTDTPQATQTSTLVALPVCPSPMAGVAANLGPTPPGSAKNPPLFPLLLGGGGLLGGILIGLLIGTRVIGAGISRGHASPTSTQAGSGDPAPGMHLPTAAMDYAVGGAHVNGDGDTADGYPPPDPMQDQEDQRSKLDNIVSNVLKKEQDTSDGITKDLK